MKYWPAKLLHIKRTDDLGSPLGLLSSTVAMFLVSQFAAAILVAVALIITNNKDASSYILNNSAAWQFGFILAAESLAVALVLGVLKLRKVGLSFIGLGRLPNWLDLRQAGLGFVIFYGLIIVASIAVTTFLPGINPDQKQQLGFNNIHSFSDNIFAILALVILPPVAEEVMVRGYLFSGLRARMNFWRAAIITSLLFGFAHLEIGSGGPLVWAAAIDTFILSMVLVNIREKTGALYACMAVHILNNLVAFIVQFK